MKLRTKRALRFALYMLAINLVSWPAMNWLTGQRHLLDYTEFWIMLAMTWGAYLGYTCGWDDKP